MRKVQYLEDWLSAKCESNKTRESYLFCWRNFMSFCRQRGLDAENIVEDYRTVKYQSFQDRERFLDAWQDTIRAFYTWLRKKGFAPLTVKNHLAVLRSFFGYWDVPLKVELPRHYYVVYHNRDLTKDEVRQILNFASPRDRVIWLVMAESGMRANTLVNLKYWQIKEDFEAERIPMKILLPSESLKDHVGDRWTFIGEDGYRELRNYLERRLPLKDDDYVFASEKEGRVKGKQFSSASLSVKFNRLVQKLGLDKSIGKGKPKKIRLHGLRKFFRNNMKADSSYVRFWMGHSLGTDAHYISRDLEEHRKRYAEGYKYLRIYEPSAETIYELNEKLRQKDKEMHKLQQQIDELQTILKKLERRMTTHLENILPQIKDETGSIQQRMANLYLEVENEIYCEKCGRRISKLERNDRDVVKYWDIDQNRFVFYHRKCLE